MLLNQWTARLLQFIADDSYFQTKREAPLEQASYTRTGQETKKIVRELIHHAKSRIQVADDDEPYLTPSWYVDGRNPAICRDNIKIRLLIKDVGKSRMKKFSTQGSEAWNSNYVCNCCQSLVADSKSYIKYSKLTIRQLGEISVGDVLSLQTSSLIDNSRNFSSTMSLDSEDFDQEELSGPSDDEDIEEELDTSNSSNPIIALNVDLKHKEVISVLLKEVICLTAKDTPLKRADIKEDEFVKKIREMYKDHLVDRRILEEEISRLQSKLSVLAIKMNDLERQIEDNYKKSQSSWMPSVLLRGSIVKKTDPKHPFQAAKSVVETDKTLLFCAKHTTAAYKVTKVGGDLAINKY